MLFLFALFLVGGNFFRLFSLPSFPNYLSIVECLLYAVTLPRYFIAFRKSQALIAGIALSTLYGIILNGFDLAGVLYSAKLIAMIGAGVVMGEILFRKYSEQQMIDFFLKIFVWILVVGSVIFLFFPKAHLFFQFLDAHGVHFRGDPHQRRFISTFFDPNYYSAIACIPLILCWHMRKYFLFSLFLVSIVLSFSRSGIVMCMLLLFCMIFSRMPHFKTSPFRWRTLSLGLFFIVPFFYSNEWGYFFHRLVGLGDDPSALARLDNFQIGISYFAEHPLLGTGYHLSLDSSMLVTLIHFGVIPCLGLAIGGIIWSVLQFSKPHSPLFTWLYIYVLVCILFTSQFNNLLYFQYWLIPIISLFTYMQKEADEMRTRS